MHALSACSTVRAEVRLQERPHAAATPADGEVARLAALARDGDRAAFALLVEGHAGLVRGLLLARAPAHEVPDLCQEAFASALASIATLSDPARFGPWLCTIARNLAHDAARRAGTRPRSLSADLPEPAATQASPADAAASAELLERVRALPEAYRETLILRLVEGLTGSEIAARTGLTHGSVRVNLHRGMHLLRRDLEGRIW